MAGSWELKQQNQVVVEILHTEHTSVAWALGLRNLIVPGHILPLTGMPFDHARNAGAQACLESGADWLFCYDSDIIPPHDAIVRLISRQKPIISGVYHRRSPPYGIPVMMKPVGMWIVDYPPNAIISVDVVGSGCLLIHRSVLERMQPDPRRPEKRWFDWRVDCKGLEGAVVEECLSEDFSFCARARKEYGYEILVDTSVQCKHVGLAEATHKALNPCQANPRT